MAAVRLLLFLGVAAALASIGGFVGTVLTSIEAMISNGWDKRYSKDGIDDSDQQTVSRTRSGMVMRQR